MASAAQVGLRMDVEAGGGGGGGGGGDYHASPAAEADGGAGDAGGAGASARGEARAPMLSDPTGFAGRAKANRMVCLTRGSVVVAVVLVITVIAVVTVRMCV